MVTHAYPRWEGDVAGAFIERLTAALAARGHDVSVVAPADRGTGGTIDRDGITIVRARYAPAGRETLAYRGTMVETVRSPLGALAATSLVVAQARAVAARGRAAAAELVHAHWWIPGGIAAWLARRLRRAPYVVTLHGTDVRLLERSAATRAVARRVLGRAAAVTAVSSYLADIAARWTGLDPQAIVVQPMPVAVDRFQPAGTGGGGVVTVGRLSPQKRIEVVIDAVARLRERGRALSLTVIGDGSQRASLERRAQGRGLGEAARFLGSVPPDRLAAALDRADVFAFPAVGEGYGLACAEALMLGTPIVVAADGGGTLDVVGAAGAGGARIVEGTDPDAWAAAIAASADDPEARRQAAGAGARLRQTLAPDSVAQAFERIYRAALDGERRR